MNKQNSPYKKKVALVGFPITLFFYAIEIDLFVGKYLHEISENSFPKKYPFTPGINRKKRVKKDGEAVLSRFSIAHTIFEHDGVKKHEHIQAEKWKKIDFFSPLQLCIKKHIPFIAL